VLPNSGIVTVNPLEDMKRIKVSLKCVKRLFAKQANEMIENKGDKAQLRKLGEGSIDANNQTVWRNIFISCNLLLLLFYILAYYNIQTIML